MDSAFPSPTGLAGRRPLAEASPTKRSRKEGSARVEKRREKERKDRKRERKEVGGRGGRWIKDDPE